MQLCSKVPPLCLQICARVFGASLSSITHSLSFSLSLMYIYYVYKHRMPQYHIVMQLVHIRLRGRVSSA